ncbi:VacB/RNase II family 3'-5' exoribonuclease [Gilvimarinus sp. DA14]|uniref:VacB/RNase II family 3'-5' exoribonuclease n=1 Tax=Gilvimarinus sp. DA14 TaxID=2956798 RepID=UPI0020B8AE27|nr:VacB/RNase II family 3'-5' exoribonuclease [Gilvimarinus sp. DA14]UTF60841.1 VacB/RNase II family 3'-5' exoribonuclease [Gilvimarinus sp. DA14]
MLSKDALSQLSQLKSNIVSNKEYAEGVVRPTAKRFGFVRLDDGRDAFLDPDQMLRVLPGDRVKISLTENSKKQLEATLESLLESSLSTFVGRYVRKGPAHFVEPDLPPFSRWLFIPPQERTNCSEGDLVQCELIRHPFKHEGKAQIRVINRIGKPEEPGIEGRYICAKFQLPGEWSEAAAAQAATIKPDALQGLEREDLSDIPFVTIDSEFTRDMDDALYAEKTANGWRLISAIADPSSLIELGSPLEQTAQERVSTLYLLGHPITMLPTELSHETFSLIPDAERPAVICTMDINSDGSIEHYTFNTANIKSHHKLSYQNVSELLDDSGDTLEQELPATIIASLRALADCAKARLNYRQENALVMEDRADYQYWLNDNKKIERIEKRLRNTAQKVVEEAMLATNICAGELFNTHPNSAYYSGHIGFRPERLDDVKALVAEVLPELSELDFTQLENFQRLFKTLRQNAVHSQDQARLLSLLQRMQQAGSLTTQPVGHFGLGFNSYATVTSPIRRYQDLHNHMVLKAILRGETPQQTNEEQAIALQETLSIGRQASRTLEQWLLCQYLSEHLGTVQFGTITGVSARGISVRLEEVGTDGFVQLAEKGQPKPKFDSRRLSLVTDTAEFFLDQTVAVKIKDVDVNSRRISLELVDPAMAERLQAFDKQEQTTQ